MAGIQVLDLQLQFQSWNPSDREDAFVMDAMRVDDTLEAPER